MTAAIASPTPEPLGEWHSASLMPRGKDALGNDTLLFGDKPIRAAFDMGPRPMLALVDVLVVCGLKTSGRKHLDARGITALYPFGTNGGIQSLKVVDLDDAYRIAMQGKSVECRDFRDFLVDVLRRIETGRPINAPQPPPQAPPIDANASPLVQQAALLLSLAVKADEHERQIAEAKRAAESNSRQLQVVAEQIAKIEGDRIEAEHRLMSLPSPTVQAPAKSPIDLTEQRVRFWAAANGGGKAFQTAYARLYEEIRRRLHFDPRQRFNPSLHASKLDVCRSEKPDGMSFDDFHAKVYAIACEAFPLEPRLF